jgi:hypothetical protein
MSAKVAAPTILLLIIPSIIAAAIILISTISGGSKSVCISLRVAVETVKRFSVTTAASEVEDTIVVENVHNTINVVGIYRQSILIKVVSRSSVDLKSGQSVSEQTSVSEGNGGVHDAESTSFFKKIKKKVCVNWYAHPTILESDTDPAALEVANSPIIDHRPVIDHALGNVVNKIRKVLCSTKSDL